MESLIVFFSLTIIELLVITLLSRLGKEWLVSSIILNLILIGTLGAKTVSLFGHITNSGNVFYAAVFFAIYLLIEFYGKEEVYKSVWVSTVFMGLFLLLTELVISAGGTAETRQADQALRLVLQSLPRTIIASVVAFVATQMVNIRLYVYIRRKTKGSKLWLRNIISLSVGQCIDSILFFSIAFIHILPKNVLLEVMIVGLIAKIIVGVVSTPFLYLSRTLQKE